MSLSLRERGEVEGLWWLRAYSSERTRGSAKPKASIMTMDLQQALNGKGTGKATWISRLCHFYRTSRSCNLSSGPVTPRIVCWRPESFTCSDIPVKVCDILSIPLLSSCIFVCWWSESYCLMIVALLIATTMELQSCKMAPIAPMLIPRSILDKSLVDMRGLSLCILDGTEGWEDSFWSVFWPLGARLYQGDVVGVAIKIMEMDGSLC